MRKVMVLFLVCLASITTLSAQMPKELQDIVRPPAAMPEVKMMSTTSTTASAVVGAKDSPIAPVPPVLSPFAGDVKFSPLTWLDPKGSYSGEDRYQFTMTITGEAARRNVSIYKGSVFFASRRVDAVGDFRENEEQIVRTYTISGLKTVHEYWVRVDDEYAASVAYAIPAHPPVNVVVKVRETTSSTIHPEGYVFGPTPVRYIYLVGADKSAVEGYRRSDPWDKRPGGVSEIEASMSPDAVVHPQGTIFGPVFGYVKLLVLTSWGEWKESSVVGYMLTPTPPPPSPDIEILKVNFDDPWGYVQVKVSFKDVPAGSIAYVWAEGFRDKPIDDPWYWWEYNYHGAWGGLQVLDEGGAGSRSWLISLIHEYTYTVYAVIYDRNGGVHLYRSIEGVKLPTSRKKIPKG